jgi:hypothetical protein
MTSSLATIQHREVLHAWATIGPKASASDLVAAAIATLGIPAGTIDDDRVERLAEQLWHLQMDGQDHVAWMVDELTLAEREGRAS